MNALLHASVSDLWSLAGWTMVHFLWLGAIVAAVATVARIALRSASPNARYAVAIGSLFLLAALPLATAAWLVKYAPPVKGGAGGGTTGPITQSATAQPTPATANDLIELHAAETPTAPGSAGSDLASGVQPPVASALPLPLNARQSRGRPAATAVQPSASPATFNALLESCVAYLPWLWLIGTPLTFALLVSGVVGTRRLGRSSHAIDSDPIVELLAHLASSLCITRRVSVAVCDRIASPVLIGIIRPMILLPPAAITGWSPDELEMVLLHELAHVRRWDNLVNLLQRCVESLLFFHPAVWLISNWTRREREACCDATVVARTNRPHAYAELLVALAAQLPRSVLFHPAATSAMAAGPLRSRIRQILKLEDDPMLISGKSLALMLGSLLVAATLIVLYVPTIGHADTTAKDDSSSDSKSQKDEYPYKVEFKEGASKFLEGDEITIDEIRGTSKEIKPGNKYRITGKYKLRSHPSASISAYTTAKEAKDGIGPTQSVQSKDITQGEGDFTLILPMGIQGWPHISFYSGGPDFGGIYFGTGDTLLKWWGTEKSTDEAEYAKYPLPAKFFYEVKFEKGESKFLDGDDITINEIRGDAKTFEPGNNYLIQGRYKLHSHPEAQLSAFTTAKEAKDGVGPIQSIQTQKISKGEADFTIILPMTVRGWPHLSFYNTKSGEGFGGIYFGTGDSVLKESWAFGKLIEDEKRDSAHSHNSNDTESANDEERTRFEHFEKSLKTIELVIAVFNDSAGYSHQLEPVYNSLAKEHHSLYLWGLKVDAKSPGAERYHITDAPTCIVFRNGKETSRLAPIKDAEQLKRFIELAAGARKVTVKPDGSVVAEGLESYDANSAPRAAEESAKLIGPFKNIATSPTDASVYKLPAPLQTVFPELPELVKQMKEDPAHPQFAYNLKDSGTTLEVLAPKVVQEQYFEKRLSQWRDSANIPPTPATITHFSKFPSLEEQKLADLAYKRLGLELEPIDEVDLNRVKALGYDGGVKVASGSAGLGGLEDSMIRQGDILVGLGVWPTTNMKAVGEILARPETADLNPVKFYVVRGETLPAPTGEIPQTRDILHTGRVEIRNAGSPEVSYNTAPPTSGVVGLAPQYPGGFPATIVNQSLAQAPQSQPAQVRDNTDPYASVQVIEPSGSGNDETITLASKPLALAVHKNEHFLIFFYSPSLPNGLDFPAIREQYKELKKQFPPNSFGAAVVDVTHNQPVAHIYNVLQTPSYAVFWKGELLYRRSGLQQNDELLRSLQSTPNNIPAANQAATTLQPITTVDVPTSLAVSQNMMPSASLNLFTAAAQRLEEAVQRKSEAMEKRLAAKGDEEVEKTKRDLDAANKQLEEAKRQFEEAKRQREKLDTENTLKEIDKQHTILDSSSSTPAISPSGDAARPVQSQRPVDENLWNQPVLRGSIVVPNAQPTNAIAPANSGAAAPGGKADLRYDGKTFAEWREMLTNELSTERRIEAIKALAAFGRAGYAKEASQAILNIAGEYDFYTMQGNATPEGKLKEIIERELAPDSRTESMAKYWVPDVIGRLANDPEKWKWLAIRLLGDLKTDDAAAVSAVEQLTKNTDADLRSIALRVIVISDHLQGSRKLSDKTQQLLTSALQSKNPREVHAALNSLVYTPPNGGSQSEFNPALATLVFDPHSDVQLAARNVLKWLPKEDAAKLVDKYLAVLKDESRKADHVAAIRALGTLGTAGEPAVTQLERIFPDDGQDLPSRVAAAFAIDQIEGGVRCQDLLLNIQNSTTDEKMKTRLNNLSNEERQLHNR